MNSPFLITPFEIKSITEEGENYIVEGMASVYGNVDLGGDIVAKGAFSEDLMKNGNERPILWQHVASEPIGIGKFSDMESGLYVKIRMPKSDQFVNSRVMPQVKVGALKGLSIGYIAEDAESILINGDKVRKLKRCKLLETSIVTFPMNEQARILAAKQYLLDRNIKTLEDKNEVSAFKDYPLADMETKWSKRKAVKQIKEKTNSQDSASEKYKNGFLYYDADNQEKLSAYSMPYVIVEDGQYKAVPKAIFEIAAALSGVSDGIDIPENEKEKIKQQINRYYEKMDREPPFKGGKTYVCLDTIRAFQKRDYEKLLKKDNNIILSRKAEKYIINLLVCGEDSDSEQVGGNGILEELKELNKQLDKMKGE